MIDEKFQITDEHITEFHERGFLLLRNFYTPELIAYLRETVGNYIKQPTDRYQSGFNRLAFDMYDGDEKIIELLGNDTFRATITELTGRTMFFAQALSFELAKLKDKGFPWHIGTQSFGYQHAKDYGCTIWAPLDPIDPTAQRGGMAYVPKNIVSGDFLYSHIDPATFRLLDEKIAAEEEFSVEEFVELRDGPLNDPAMKRLLDHFAFEDDFAPGDALIFDKDVIHRSVMLGEGPLDSRAAFVMRFFGADSTYDRGRAHDLEIPRHHYGYDGPTKFHLEVAQREGQPLVDSPIFAGQGYRLLTRR